MIRPVTQATQPEIPGKYLYFTTISTAQETDLICKV